MSNMDAEMFSTTSWKKYEISKGLSDLYDNLHTVLRFYKIL